MGQSDPNHPENITTIFSGEGDALRRAGFHEPDFTARPDDFTLAEHQPEELATAYDEAAAMGHDLDEHLEG